MTKQEIKAIESLVPDANFIVENLDTLVWLDDRAQPTTEEITAKVAELDIEDYITEQHIKLSDYIYFYYSPVKQSSDLADKVYFETILNAQAYPDLNLTIMNKTVLFYEGTPLQTLLEDVATDYVVAIEQLLKAAIRVTWVQHCKQELVLSLTNNVEANYPTYPIL